MELLRTKAGGIPPSRHPVKSQAACPPYRLLVKSQAAWPPYRLSAKSQAAQPPDGPPAKAHVWILSDEVLVRIGIFAVGFSLAIGVSCRAALACREYILKIGLALDANMKYLWGSSELRTTCTRCRRICKRRDFWTHTYIKGYACYWLGLDEVEGRMRLVNRFLRAIDEGDNEWREGLMRCLARQRPAASVHQ